jgi:hypothetical protein
MGIREDLESAISATEAHEKYKTMLYEARIEAKRREARLEANRRNFNQHYCGQNGESFEHFMTKQKLASALFKSATLPVATFRCTTCGWCYGPWRDVAIDPASVELEGPVNDHSADILLRTITGQSVAIEVHASHATR